MANQSPVVDGNRDGNRDGNGRRPPHVVFIHLDLGIGGAESLVINLAKASLPRGDDDDKGDKGGGGVDGTVSIYTTYRSPLHCYDDVRPPSPENTDDGGGFLASSVRVRGSWIPRTILGLGFGTALCSAIRTYYLTTRARLECPCADLFVMDVLPTGVPYLVRRWNVSAGVLFYCHFPDKLLTGDTVNGEADEKPEEEEEAGRRRPGRILGLLKRWYRRALDASEERSMSHSDLIVVNSNFTRGEVETVFPSLFRSDVRAPPSERDGDRVKVLYPAIESSLLEKDERRDEASGEPKPPGPIVSLNRFERKKNVALLIRAYALLIRRDASEKKEDDDRRNEATTIAIPPLVVAGGYDPRNVENVAHLAELKTLAFQTLGLPPSSVSFRPSVSDDDRRSLLTSASVVCYTPHREHFGIVPLEAMDAGVPVVALRSGGPIETILHGETGYLVDPADGPPGYAEAIRRVVSDPRNARDMGRNGRSRVANEFGMEAFRERWAGLATEARRRGGERHRRAMEERGGGRPSIYGVLSEVVAAVFMAVALTYLARTLGLLEPGLGVWGTVRVRVVERLTDNDEL